MTIWNKKALIDNLKNHINSWSPQAWVFSYDLTHSSIPNGINLVLLQKETGFLLSLTLENQHEQLTLQSFTLISNPQLGVESLALFDAAMVEIVLQGLEIVFAIAHQTNNLQICFLLPKEDGAHLSSFHSFFHSISYQGNQVCLILPTDKPAYTIFAEQIQIMNTKIRTALWKQQREDDLLKSYLQNRHQEGFSLLEICWQEPTPTLFSSNVLAFPFPRHQIELEHAL